MTIKPEKDDFENLFGMISDRVGWEWEWDVDEMAFFATCPATDFIYKLKPDTAILTIENEDEFENEDENDLNIYED